jgi:four helix bundle protein
MSGLVRDFRELDVYKKAYGAALRIFETTKTFPPEEKYALTTQIRNSSRSICSSLGEAWGKRIYPKHFTSKLTDAVSEAYETKVWLDFSTDHGYMRREEHESLSKEADEICAMLFAMIANPNSWCIRSEARKKSVRSSGRESKMGVQ